MIDDSPCLPVTALRSPNHPTSLPVLPSAFFSPPSRPWASLYILDMDQLKNMFRLFYAPSVSCWGTMAGDAKGDLVLVHNSKQAQVRLRAMCVDRQKNVVRASRLGLWAAHELMFGDRAR